MTGPVTVRRTTSGDQPLLRALFAGLSVEDRFSRFFSPFAPDDQFLDKLAAANEQGACQLIALLDDCDGNDACVGEASAWPLANGNAELGITVRQDCRGWLGRQLFDVLVETARTHGFPMLEAELLMTNRPMLGLLRTGGYAAAGHDGYRTARLVISTAPGMPGWVAGDTRPRVLVEAPAARWDGEETVLAAGVQIMVCPGPRGGAERPCPALVGETCPLAEGADAIVTHLGPELDTVLHAAHARVHEGVPVCIHPGGANVFDVAHQVVQMARAHAR